MYASIRKWSLNHTISWTTISTKHNSTSADKVDYLQILLGFKTFANCTANFSFEKKMSLLHSKSSFYIIYQLLSVCSLSASFLLQHLPNKHFICNIGNKLFRSWDHSLVYVKIITKNLTLAKNLGKQFHEMSFMIQPPTKSIIKEHVDLKAGDQAEMS